MSGQFGAVILAAGSSIRFGSDKLSIQIGGEPVWLRSYRAFRTHPEVAFCGIVTSADRVEAVKAACPDADFVVAGGETRQESARNGVLQLPCEFALIHDAARPFVSASLISSVIAAARERGASCPALPVTDTIKQSKGDQVETLHRPDLHAVQTPQAARVADLLRAYDENPDNATDDLAILERFGIFPLFVPGDFANIKITRPNDLPNQMETRTGLGYDIHAFSHDPERRMFLGGVEFDDRPGLEGHSDADVLLHAVTDALLGSIGADDIGVHFPNTDPRWKNVSSLEFLRHAAQILKESGWSVVNLDSTVLAERPKIMVRRMEIREKIAQAIGIDIERVSVKATTQEKLGAIGRGEGIAAFATATVARSTIQGGK